MKQITFALIATAIGLILAFSGSAAAIYAASHSPMGGPDNPDKFPTGFPHQKVSKQCSMDGFCGAAELKTPEHHSNKHHTDTQTTSDPTAREAWNVNLNQTVLIPKSATYPQT